MRRVLHASPALVAVLAASACAFADEPKPAAPTATAAPAAPEAEGEAAAKKPVAVIKLDIDEKVDGKPHRDTPAIYKLREKLREFGFLVYTEKPLRGDEIHRKKAEKEAAEKGLPAPPPEERPAPDVVIKGLIDVSLGRTSTFYGQNVAYMYNGVVDLVISDGAGKELKVVEERDEWGKTEAKTARDEQHKRITLFAAASVLKAEPIRSRLGPKRQAALDEWVEKIERKRASSGGPSGGDDGGAAAGGKEEGKK